MNESQKKQAIFIVLAANIFGCMFFILNGFESVFVSFWFGICTAFDLILISSTNFLNDPEQKKIFRYAGIVLFVAAVIHINHFIFST